MIILLDFDSILYHSVYKIVSIEQMRYAITDFGKVAAKQWLLETIYEEGIERCEKEIESIKHYVQSQLIDEIESVELYITTCNKSFRKQICSDYKSNRKTNKYVWMLREHYSINGAFSSETHEADDLIARRAKELGKGNYIVVSIDKDLKQIGGYFWSYYKQKKKDDEGNFILNESGFYEREYKMKDIEYISEDDAERLFWIQMLMGDNTDGIKGLNRVGVKTAEKIVNNTKVPWMATAREYISRNKKDLFKINYKLLKLS